MTGTEDTIGTHDGSFHCDEALGCYLLQNTEQFSNCRIVRTRDADALAKCAVVLDVGAEYDVAKLRFDHHQKGFSETFNDFKTKLSSAGLVYKHFGKEIVSKKIEKSVEDPVTNQLYLKMYKSFIEAVDGVDNGVFYFFSLSLSLSLSSKAFRLRINASKIKIEKSFSPAVSSLYAGRVLYIAVDKILVIFALSLSPLQRKLHHPSCLLLHSPLHYYFSSSDPPTLALSDSLSTADISPSPAHTEDTTSDTAISPSL